jgi:hypothetical protein
LRRLEIVYLILVILTLVSDLVPPILVGAFPALFAGLEATGLGVDLVSTGAAYLTGAAGVGGA